MSVIAFDTHAVVKQLMAAGFTDQQAEAITLVEGDAQDVDLSALATKTDLIATKAHMKANFAEARANMKVDLAETKAEILNWMFGSMGFQIVIVIGAILSLSRLLPR